MAFLPIAIAGLSALGGALGNRSSTQQQQSTTTGTSTTTPNIDPKTLSFRNDIINNYLAMLQHNGIDLSGYQANAISNINQTRALQQQKNREMLAAHGIFGPAAELSSSNIDNSRFGDIIQLNNSLPLLRQQLQQSILSGAGDFFRSIPIGSTVNTNSTQKGTVTQPGNVAGGAVGGGASALAYLYGQGAFGGNSQAHNVGWK